MNLGSKDTWTFETVKTCIIASIASSIGSLSLGMLRLLVTEYNAMLKLTLLIH